MTIEELQQALLEEQDARKALQAELEKVKADNTSLTDANTRLIDANNKLFMRVTTKEEEPEQEPTPEEKEQAQIDRIRNLMHGGK